MILEDGTDMFSETSMNNYRPTSRSIQKNEGLIMKIFQLVAYALDNTKPQLNSLYFFAHCATDPGGPEPPYCRGFEFTLKKTAHSVGLLWTSDQPDAETSTLQHTTRTGTDIHSPGGIRTLGRRPTPCNARSPGSACFS